jgi:ribosomal-protein-alanine N-acetyltransferase
MTRLEPSIAPARVSDVRPIALGSRALIENGLGWSWTPSRVEASRRSKTALVIVARLVDRRVGFAIMRYGAEEAHLDLLAVDPDHRRRGVGRRLVEWLEEPALLAGITAVLLEVRAENHAARAFYERLGYRNVERLAGYYQGRESAIRMRRALGCGGAPPVIVWRTSVG